MDRLDLHGVKHADVEDRVENFIFLHEPPMQIITGNSHEMQQIVIRILERHHFKFAVGDALNQGYIKVLG